ncbi:hypothetical protein H4219_000633 [Mycoemilia scoparia]|uniref:N-acetyltransferase domain-containing protein n=1 Tax=Mycoemilia scoparia TaxID=417184 RepID=A0A9W8ABP7_9FUNG|nr:hypothetical protein H4219_000633 [Mycoemilia scoparia]
MFSVPFTDCVQCLKKKPLRGDSFYTFRCSTCENGKEFYQRTSASWVQVIYLVLYHLMTGEPDKKYFRWRENICAVIDEYWAYLLPGKERTATWHNTIAGCLSTHNAIFKSGLEETGIPGNWALVEKVPPPKHGFDKPTKIKDPNKPARQPRKTDGSGGKQRREKPQASNTGDTARKSNKKPSYPKVENGNKHSKGSDGESDTEIPSRKRAKLQKDFADSDMLQSLELFNNLRQAHQSNVTPSSQATEAVKSSPHNQGESATSLTQNMVSPSKDQKQPNPAKAYSKEKFKTYLSSDSSEISSLSDDDDEGLSDWSSDPEINAMLAPLLKKEKATPSKSSASNAKDKPEAKNGSSKANADENGSSTPWPVPQKEEEEIKRASISDKGDTLIESPAGKTLPNSYNRSRSHTIDFSSSDSESCPTKKPKTNDEAPISNSDNTTLTSSFSSTSIISSLIPKTNLTPKDDDSNDGLQIQKPTTFSSSKTHQLNYKNNFNLVSPLSNEKIIPTPSIFICERIEWEMAAKLDHCKLKLPPEALRLRRRLHLRRLKRLLGLNVFNIDSSARNATESSRDILIPFEPEEQPEAIVDVSEIKHICVNKQTIRDADYQPIIKMLSLHNDSSNGQLTEPRELTIKNHTPYSNSFLSRLVGDGWMYNYYTSSTPKISPFHGRILRPFIWRDYFCNKNPPVGLQILRSIKMHNRPDNSREHDDPDDCISYCYFQAQHLDQVNELLSRTFWPGIDVSEALACPEFSVVALYRRLVVGCAFVTPDAYLTYIAVSSGWEGASIATFMLYHLFQTNPNKDMTLHVAATNPAMILYQKFGFKPEQYLVEFYSKYLPKDSRQCSNAFFMRLRRH